MVTAHTAAPAAPAVVEPLRVRLLGDLELRRGALLPLPPSRRTRALLGFLIATAAPQSRATLCDLLWDGTDDPRASLRWSLTKLRPVVDEAQLQRLHADRERVSFEALQCEVDTERVQQLLAGGVDQASLAALEDAAGALQGEFLDGLDLPACYRFHHWCMAERERHGNLRRAVLEALVGRLAGDPGRALPHGHAMVAADPLAEAAHATLVQLLAAAGRYPDAERHYAWARELLQREVAMPAGGVLDETIRRVRRLQREAGAVASKPAPSPSPPSPPSPPPSVPAPAAMSLGAPLLCGRDVEQGVIAQWLAAAPPVPLLLFTGEPGIGKTRLLAHLAERAMAAGWRVVRGRCFEAETVRPYGLWLDALRGQPTEGVPADTLQQAAPLLVGSAGAEGSNRERLFDAGAALLRGLAARQPVLMLVDDLQWIDEGSAALLHYLVRSLGASASVCFAGAARAGEVDDNACAKRLLQSLAREATLQRLDLGPLAAPGARALLGSANVDTDDALRQTGGNPLYLIELARAAQRGAAATGRTLEALIDERLCALDDASRDVLAWAAAMGGELRADLLAAAAGWPVAELLARLQRFERRGLVTSTGTATRTTTDGHHFDFAHGLVRQVVYRGLSQPRRRALHRQIAQTLAAASRDAPWLHGEVVHHASLAGDLPAAARACLAAGEHCLHLFANTQAAEVAERGLAQVIELPPGAERVRLELGLLRLRVAAAAGPGGRRLPALAERIEAAIASAQALSLPALAADGWELLAFWRQRASDTGRTQQATLAAVRMTRHADAGTRCLQLANSGRCLLDIEADMARGRALLDEAAELATELDLDVMEIEWGRALIARAEGDLEAAHEGLAHAVALARAADNHWREYECMVWLATVALEQGQHTELLHCVDQIVAASARMGEPEAPFAQALGALARLRGEGHDKSAAEVDLAASLAALRERDDKAHLAYALNEAAALAIDTDRREAAAAYAREALAAAQAVRRPTEVTVAAARLACATRDAQQAAEAATLAPPVAERSARAAAALAAAVRAISTLVPTLAS